MANQDPKSTSAHVQIENIGGITHAEATFSPGLTTLSGENATNRTSFLKAIAAALGSNDVVLKSDADSGSVEVEFGDETYTRTLSRNGDRTTFDGDPYTDETTKLDLFCLLFRDNEARRAIEQGEDLRDLIMRPVDTDSIEAREDELISKRNAIENDIEERDRLKKNLPSLEEQRTTLETEIEELENEIADVEDDLEQYDSEAESSETQDELDQKLSQLSDKRDELDAIESNLQQSQERIETLETQIEEAEQRLVELDEVDENRIESLRDQLNSARARSDRLDVEIDEINSVIQFNEELLDGEGTVSILSNLGDSKSGDSSGLVTEEDTITCWTCGQQTTGEKIESMLDDIREARANKFEQRKETRSKISELQDTLKDLTDRKEERSRLQKDINQWSETITKAETQIEQDSEQKEELQSQIDDLEAEIEHLKEQDQSEYTELRSTLNTLQRKYGNKESELTSVSEKITDHEQRIDELDDREKELEEVRDELREVRGKILELEKSAIEAFNTHMEEIINRLDYGNIERIWLESAETTEKQGRRKVDKTEFRLNVVREDADGNLYQDDYENLSESEREVAGITLAFAGYLTHDLDEEIPFLILDSLESIDASRIADLLEYITDYADYTFVALLEEDASVVEEQIGETIPISSANVDIVS